MTRSPRDKAIADMVTAVAAGLDDRSPDGITKLQALLETAIDSLIQSGRNEATSALFNVMQDEQRSVGWPFVLRSSYASHFAQRVLAEIAARRSDDDES